jgi:hypothetical protein
VSYKEEIVKSFGGNNMTKEIMAESDNKPVSTEVPAEATTQTWYSSREDAIVSALGDHGAFSISAKTNRLIVDLRHMKRDAGESVKSVIISESRRLSELGEPLSIGCVRKQFKFLPATGKEVEQITERYTASVTPEVFSYLKNGSRFESYGLRNVSFLLAGSEKTSSAPTASANTNTKVDAAAAAAADQLINSL